MDARTIISALFGLLISHYTSANTACFPGVYSDGKANVVVVHQKSSDVELAFLTLNGLMWWHCAAPSPRLFQPILN